MSSCLSRELSHSLLSLPQFLEILISFAYGFMVKGRIHDKHRPATKLQNTEIGTYYHSHIDRLYEKQSRQQLMLPATMKVLFASVMSGVNV